MPRSRRRISRVFWRTVQVAVYAVLFSTVVFFSLTRTEVGRDTLRQQIESQFDARFAGSLSIDRLQGNLVNDLFASDVRLLDADGQVVARVDSIVARPRWSSLLSRTISVRSLTFIRPSVTLHRDSSGTWNAQRALRRVSPSTGGATVDLVLADARVVDGRVTTTSDGPPPRLVRDEWLFNYADADVRALNARTTIEWTPGERLVEVYDVSMALPEHEVSVTSMQGQFIRADDGWSVRPFQLQTQRSDLEVAGSVRPPTDATELEVDLRVEPSRLDFDELRRLLPRLPLASTATLRGYVHGSLSGLVVDAIALERGRSRLELAGTVLGLPDSLDFETQLLDSRLTPPDVRAVLPDADLSRLAPLGSLAVDAYARGVVHWADRNRPDFDVAGTIDAVSKAGAVRGSLSVARSGAQSLRYDASLRTDSLDAGRFLRTSDLATQLNGRIEIDGRGTSPDSLAGTLALRVGTSVVNGEIVDSLRLDASVANRTGDVRLALTQSHGGSLNARGSVDLSTPTAVFDLAVRGDQLDLAALSPVATRLPATRLNVELMTGGRGRSFDDLSGALHVRVDSSLIVRGDSLVTLPPHQSTLRLADPSAPEPRLVLEGTVVALTVDGDVSARPLWALGRLWRTALTDAVRREVDKPYPRPVASADTSTILAADAPAAAVDLTPLREAARAALDDAGREPGLSFQTALQIRDLDVLRAWIPGLPRLQTPFDARASVALNPDSMHVNGTATGRVVHDGAVRVHAPRLSFEASGTLDNPLVETLSARADVRADTAWIRGYALEAPTVTASYADRRGQLDAEAEGEGETGPFRLSAALDVRPDHNEVTVRDIYVEASQYAWQNTNVGRFDVYADAIVIDPFVLASPRLQTLGVQEVRLRGTLSSAPTDTVHAEVNDVLFYPISELAHLNKPIGGLLNGRVSLTGGWKQPQISGDFVAERLSFDHRLLGRLHLTSRYVPGSPDLRVRADLRPEAMTLDDLREQKTALIPGGLYRAEPNRLRLDGTIRLPRLASDASAAAPETTASVPSDRLDLTLDVTRADLFFFEYIFETQMEDVQGYTAGSARITGSFTDPTFDADMRVRDGRFSMPRFGLRYRVEGDVDVDREGFKLSDVVVRDDEGSALVNGGILFNDYRYFSFDLRGVLDELTIIDVRESEELPFYGTIRASGPATLTGPLSDATLRSPSARTTPDSELFIPVSEEDVDEDSGFIIFADSTGALPNLADLTQRDNILSDRPAGEPSFIDGLEIDVNVTAPEESTVHLVFDPLVGDVVTAVGTGRVQLQRQEGEFYVYGRFDVSGGDYLFTAGEVFVRRFTIDDGTLTWDGDPTNAQLDIDASYRTRASPAGLPGFENAAGRIPVIVRLDITGRVETPRVDLSLSLARDERSQLVGTRTLDAVLNQPDLATEYATSVLLTNTFLLTTSSFTSSGAAGDGGNESLAAAGNQLAFNSVSQLVASQLNRYLSAALPNVDVNVGLQGEDPEDLDIIYGVALRLLNERLIIRGEGVYTGDEPTSEQASGPQGEFVVEVRLSRRVSVEVFYRRTGDDVTQQTLTSSTGAGLSYQTEFSTWERLMHRLFGWLLPGDDSEDDDAQTSDDAIATREDPRPSDVPPSDDASEDPSGDGDAGSDGDGEGNPSETDAPASDAEPTAPDDNS